MKQLKILMIHPHDIYSSSEPWTIRITSLAKSLVKRGHLVKLCYFPLPKKQRGRLRSSKIKEFETIPLKRSKWYIFENINKVVKYGKWCDVVHFQKCFPIAALPAIFSAFINNRHIHYDWDDWEYGIYMFNPPSKLYGIYLKILEMTIPKLVNSISVSSDELLKMTLKLNIPNRNLVKINVCADLNRFKPRPKNKELSIRYNLKSPLVLYLGQLHGAQYAELLIRAALKINKHYPKINFLIVGGGADLPRLKNIVESQNLNKNIKFTGYISDDDVNACLSIADVAVACFENTKQVRCKSPLKIAEYLASGKAIVASNVGEVAWMLNNSGVLTKPGDVDSLSDGIITLLQNKTLRSELEIKARNRAVTHMDWENVTDRLINLYRASVK